MGARIAHAVKASHGASLEEGDLLLAALFLRRIDHADDDAKGARIEALVVKFGRNTDAVFFGGYADSLAPVPEYGGDDAPTRDD